MKQTNFTVRWVWTSALALGLAAGGAAAQGDGVEGAIRRVGGQTLQGQLRWKAASKLYEVRLQGSMATIPLNQVEAVRVREPADLNAAVKAVQGGSFTGPHIATLAKIVNDYLMLEHDLTAARWLAEAHLRTGRKREAAEVLNRVIADRDRDQLAPDVVRVYWNTLLETEQFASLRRELDLAIERGQRPVAAVAQMMRGEIDMRRDAYREALVDGFLRTIILFGDVPGVQPEALFKAARCFEELGESAHAEKMRKKLLAEYPDASYSRQLMSGS